MPIKLELPLSSVSNVEQSEKLSGVKCAEHTNNFELKLFSILLKIKININHAHSQYGSLRRIWEVPTSSSQPGMVHFCHFRCRDGKLNSVYRLKFFLSHSLNRSVLTSPLSPGGGLLVIQGMQGVNHLGKCMLYWDYTGYKEGRMHTVPGVSSRCRTERIQVNRGRRLITPNWLLISCSFQNSKKSLCHYRWSTDIHWPHCLCLPVVVLCDI